MRPFSVKFKDETQQIILATFKKISESVSQVSFTEPLDYEKIKYIEIAMHDENIYAVDTGYYLINGGSKRSSNYGIGSFKPMTDREEVLIKRRIMPVFELNHEDNCRIAIVTPSQLHRQETEWTSRHYPPYLVTYPAKQLQTYTCIKSKRH